MGCVESSTLKTTVGLSEEVKSTGMMMKCQTFPATGREKDCTQLPYTPPVCPRPLADC